MRKVKGPVQAQQNGGRDAAGSLLKDEVLSRLADVANVAQFVSFDPRPEQRHARIYGYEADHPFGSVEAAASALLKASPDKSVNVRSFLPGESKSLEFLYGLTGVEKVSAEVRRLASNGFYTIVNETVNVNDGGVSGVLLGDTLEFAPGDTPRCVEKPGTASLPRQMGLRLLEKVYHFRPELYIYARDQRVEFSVHPIKRGVENGHTIIWELERFEQVESAPNIRWPNKFSRFMGDKAFGLLIADVLGLPVPATTVFPRWLPPFSFGRPTGTGEVWIRTCPAEQNPGKFSTARGWLDPYKVMAEEDGEGTQISSVLAQEGVEAVYSGALIVGTKPSSLEPDDILDWTGFFSWLGGEGRYDAPSPSRRIVELLPGELRELVLKGARAENPDQATKASLLAALNEIIKDRNFYRAAYFRRVVPTDEAEALLRREPSDLSDAEVERRNRLLLKACYLREIAGTEEVIVEGTSGFGDEFMLGKAEKRKLPGDVLDSVLQVYEQAAASLGPVRFEWVRDTERVWIVQLHRGATATTGNTIYPGEAEVWRRLDIEQGIDALRALIAEVQNTQDGIILIGNVGVNSHLGDLLRRAKIPSKIEPSRHA
ncbi:MAG TPA: hypothetical protein VN256_16425 [Pyrinomonadaceae bacterium]|nr:hypothetical protein [Pyrinomonadaceae bacterium]